MFTKTGVAVAPTLSVCNNARVATSSFLVRRRVGAVAGARVDVVVIVSVGIGVLIGILVWVGDASTAAMGVGSIFSVGAASGASPRPQAINPHKTNNATDKKALMPPSSNASLLYVYKNVSP